MEAKDTTALLVELNREVGVVSEKVTTISGQMEHLDVEVRAIKQGVGEVVTTAICDARHTPAVIIASPAPSVESLFDRAKRIISFILLVGALVGGVGASVAYLVRIGGKLDRMMQAQERQEKRDLLDDAPTRSALRP